MNRNESKHTPNVIDDDDGDASINSRCGEIRELAAG